MLHHKSRSEIRLKTAEQIIDYQFGTSECRRRIGKFKLKVIIIAVHVPLDSLLLFLWPLRGALFLNLLPTHTRPWIRIREHIANIAGAFFTPAANRDLKLLYGGISHFDFFSPFFLFSVLSSLKTRLEIQWISSECRREQSKRFKFQGIAMKRMKALNNTLQTNSLKSKIQDAMLRILLFRGSLGS